jgi:UDP-2,3-diacylglucosamine hydrolase
VSALPTLTALVELRAPVAWQTIDFISDLHLCEDTPRGFAAWAKYMHATPADAVLILGDLFEAWVGDDARHAGFESHCAQVLRETSALKAVAFMAGNRDFLVGPGLLEACGMLALSDPTVLVAGDDRMLLTHGDALCLDDTEYQQFRRLVRSPQWQSDFLKLPLSVRKEQALRMRSQSEQRKSNTPSSDWVDIDRTSAAGWMASADSRVLIHGHTHRPATEAMGPGLVRHVLSDWELDHSPHGRAEVLRWRSGALTRLPIGS